ncbi:LutC/YkgG family protein [Micromonospora sp. LZ34]
MPDDIPGHWLIGFAGQVRRDTPPLSAAELDSMDAALTGCAVAVADTGTIVLDVGSTQGRRMLTLVSDPHICVVRTGQIVGLVPEAVARLDPRAPQTWISGPSATSDIELNRVEWVHGPADWMSPNDAATATGR